MATVIRTLSTAGSRSFASSAMASLTPGQQLVGTKCEYRLLRNLREKGEHKSIVFDAQVLPKAGAADPPQWAVVKAVKPGDSGSELNFQREYDAYCRKGVRSSPCFREMYDIVEEPRCLVFRRMERTLDEVPYVPSTRCYNIIADLVPMAVNACTALHADEPKLVETDWKIDKILISNAADDHPIIRIGDLGLVRRDGELFECQSMSTRAPEVWEGCAFIYASQTWALAAMLLAWIQPGMLGFYGCKYSYEEEPWSIVKLRRLFPGWNPPPSKIFKKKKQKNQFGRAEEILEDAMKYPNAFPDIRKIKPLKEELQGLGVLSELKNLLLYMLVPDVETRPLPEKVLMSDQWAAFERAVKGAN